MNEPLLFAALVDLTMHPDKHDQNIYARRTACGTTMCLAGNVVLLVGHGFVWESDGEAYLTTNDETIAHVAQHALGISSAWSDLLFRYCNNIGDLWEWAESMTDGRVARPEGM